MSENSCIFCKIIAGDIPVKLVAQNEKAIAIEDIQPQAPQHFLIIPKKHLSSLNDLTTESRKDILPSLFDLADEVSQQKSFRKSGYRTVINNQSLAGQSVFHLHMHILTGAPLGRFGS